MGLAQSDVLYTPDARIVCAACSAKSDLLETDKRAGGNIRHAGYAALGLAVCSLVFNILFLCTLASAFSAIVALTSMGSRDDDRFTKHIGKDRSLVLICAVLALVIDAFYILFSVIGLSAMMR